MTNGSAIYRPPASFFFGVQLAGDKAAVDASFQEASGLSVEMGFEEYAEGGVNQYKHRLPSYAKYANLVLKRGLVLKELPFFQWCETTLQGGLSSPIEPRAVAVTLLGPGKAGGEPLTLKRWNLVNAWPIKWSLSDLRSQESELAIETLELTYDYFEVQ